ncbi:MFS transporter [Elizabethkingia anophelis]|uniref:MFS transporter n=1 Tax=Elizabethkingia anophelis TaxID=1117645 RepID=UPI002012BF7C|nr:MFS transporter [Elizabethkingia anophelis]MCL1690974.1 MFS transporter [Elizabethkingia anophelis]MDV3573032.1 MFS transporter [Elizabethkingia anophelis]MDV3598516.1 MFS transporter [Elizabethkingia anophelis]MDV3605428.1 MFS transporter [Elizabethkingia anophelis]MDV3638106.1 MFS transporter [Elizabethkingia anophelis]
MKKAAYIGCLTLIGIISTEFGVISILPQISEYYNVSIDKAGSLLSIFSITIAITGSIITLLTSGFNRKKIMLIAMILFLVSDILSIMAPPFGVLLVVRMLPAFLQPTCIAAAIYAAVALGDDKYKNELIGIVISGIAIASVVTVPLSGYVSGVFQQWQAAYVLQAIISLITIVIIYKMLPSVPAPKETTSLKKQLIILKDPVFILSMGFNLFLITAWFCTYSYIAEYLQKSLGMDEKTTSYMIFLFGVMGVTSNWVARKMLNKRMMPVVVLFSLGTIVLPLLLNFNTSPILTISIISLWGFWYGPCVMIAVVYMVSNAPSYALEFANSLQNSTGNLGVALGTSVGGWIIVSKGISVTPWIGAGFGIVSLAILAINSYIKKNREQNSNDKIHETEFLPEQESLCN